MLIVAALLAGIFLGLKDLIPYFAAIGSGVIKRRGAREILVRRDENPESFNRLLANRGKGAALGFGLATLGLLALLMSGALPGLLSVLVYGVCGAIAGYCVVRGFITGRMYSFWSLMLFGDATRKQSPIWFWMFTGINLLVALNGLLTCLVALGGLARPAVG